MKLRAYWPQVDSSSAFSPIGCLLILHHIVTDAGGLTLLHPTANRSTANPDEGSLELTEEIMRARAYRFFEKRGRKHGHALEDWLRANAEIFGKKTAAAEAEHTNDASMAAAA